MRNVVMWKFFIFPSENTLNPFSKFNPTEPPTLQEHIGNRVQIRNSTENKKKRLPIKLMQHPPVA